MIDVSFYPLFFFVKKKNDDYRQDANNIKGRELGIAFRGLRVTGLGNANVTQPTIGSTFNPLEIPNAIQAGRHPIIKDILSGFEGVVRPGEMLRK